MKITDKGSKNLEECTGRPFFSKLVQNSFICSHHSFLVCNLVMEIGKTSENFLLEMAKIIKCCLSNFQINIKSLNRSK